MNFAEFYGILYMYLSYLFDCLTGIMVGYLFDWWLCFYGDVLYPINGNALFIFTYITYNSF